MPMTPSDFTWVSQLVRQKSAIVLEAEKTYLVEARLAPLARTEGFASLGAMLTKMRSSPANGLHHKVVEAMTTNETSFFRDLYPFDALWKVVIPELLAEHAASRQLNIWCAAASSGQEPYTIAMVLREHFPELATWSVQFLATDLSRQMLVRAREGRFGQLEVNRGLPAPMLLKYFEKKGMEWQVRSELREMIEFREWNLIEPWRPLPLMDIVFLRNVLIYFDVETKRSILAKMVRVLRPGGFLFLGGAETTINLGDDFERLPFERSGCYRLKRTGGT
ncbi:MAG: protein-glutamate O-methyltransferase CheR [Gemmatimonadota bacterium]